ncbi:glycoside hydrolase family 32 protein [Corynebacterium sp. KPL2850]|uniref:glycoside hydrolase family 32 protein n=1 Tax=Corynebacterium sp. KPL2850 TaxID=3158318 RepID=UPI0032EDC2C3
MNHRPNFHLAPPLGRLNDPNGLFVDGDILHAFYQHDPAFPHKPKRTGWGHATTTVSAPTPWRHYPDALYPDLPYDKDGCYSGGAVVDGTDVWLFYTGNLKEDGRRIPSQNRVRVMDPSGPEGGIYVRDADNPLIADSPEGYTGHFRDPHISRAGEGWRMVIGAQTEDERGTIVLYYSQDLRQWEFQGELVFDDPAQLPGGYMWECPNLLTFGDKHVLIFCPQEETDRCGYVVGTLDGLNFHVERGFTLLDHGTQFYAPQATEENILLGWMGMPAHDETPTQGWVHTLTIPRQLWLEDNYLCQEPLWSALPETRGRDGFGSTIDVTGEGAYALVDATGKEAFRVVQGGGTISFNGGETIACPDGEMRLIADGCAVEVFAGGGRIAAAFAVFGDAPWQAWEPLD